MSAIRQMQQMFSEMIKPLRNRVYSMIKRAVLESVKDDGGMQLVKLNLLAGETRSDIERFQNFGFTSHPPDSAECIALSVGGNNDHLVVIVANDRASRILDLAKGESAFYNVNGDKLVLKLGGNLEGTLSNNLEITLKKLKFENATGEFVDIISQLFTTLEAEPFIVNKATITALKVKFLTFKV